VLPLAIEDPIGAGTFAEIHSTLRFHIIPRRIAHSPARSPLFGSRALRDRVRRLLQQNSPPAEGVRHLSIVALRSLYDEEKHGLDWRKGQLERGNVAKAA